MQYVDEKMVASVLRMADLIPVMRKAMIDFSMGKIAQPPRRLIEVQPHGGFFGSMPAAGENALGAKLVTFYPGNAKINMHTHMAMIILFRPETGEPLAIMDGRLITEMRTAAVTAAYVDAVADSGVKGLAILGAGVQAKSHLEALSIVRNFKDIRIWNRTAGRAEKLAAETDYAQAFISAEEAVRDAQVVVAVTSATKPVLAGKWLQSGTKVASVGWSGPNCGEVDAETMSHTVIVDSREGTVADSGNIKQHNAPIYAELGEILAGKKEVRADATVVFDSIGIACQDIAAATLVLDKLAL